MTAIVFLPGLICDQAVWLSQIDAFSEKGISCQVIDYGSANSLSHMAEIAIEQAPEKFILIGHSMGGRVAMEVARQAPEKISHIVLMDTGYLPLAEGDAGEKEIAGRQALIDTAAKQGMRAMGNVWMQGMVHPERLDDAALCNKILDMIERKTVEQFEAQQTALIQRPDATDVLRYLDCTTLFICGTEDAWSPLERHYDMAKLVPDSQVVAIEQSGHMSTMEQPQAVNEVLLNWLER